LATRLAITLDDDQAARLEALASARRETVSDVAMKAIAEYLAADAAFRRAVEEGLAAGRAGDVQDFEPFAEDLGRRMAVRVAEADGRS
jgi:predicted transcriptional regulator